MAAARREKGRRWVAWRRREARGAMRRLWPLLLGGTAFVPPLWRVVRAVPLLLGSQQVLAQEDVEAVEAVGGFNPLLLVVPVGVLALLRWVFSLTPKKEDNGEGYASTTLRGRDSAENLQRRIEEMEKQMKLDELEQKKLLEAPSVDYYENLGYYADYDDEEDLESPDLKTQLKAAQD